VQRHSAQSEPVEPHHPGQSFSVQIPEKPPGAESFRGLFESKLNEDPHSSCRRVPWIPNPSPRAWVTCARPPPRMSWNRSRHTLHATCMNTVSTGKQRPALSVAYHQGNAVFPGRTFSSINRSCSVTVLPYPLHPGSLGADAVLNVRLRGL
jgi:hypothetical protein